MVMIDHIKSIAPPVITTTTVLEQLSTIQSISGTEHLQCSVCMQVLSQPVELHCLALVCTPCLIGWLIVSASCKCPCCFLETPLTLADVKPPPETTGWSCVLSYLQSQCEGRDVRPAPVHSSSWVQSECQQGWFTGSIIYDSPTPLQKSGERGWDPYQRNC